MLGHCLPREREGIFGQIPRQLRTDLPGGAAAQPATCASCAIGVLAGLAALLLTVVVIDYLPPIGGFRLPGELGKLVINGTKITMQQPRLTGFTVNSRAYEFSANSAAQDITKPNLVVMTNLNAKMEMQDKSTVQMSAIVRHLRREDGNAAVSTTISTSPRRPAMRDA